MSTPNQGQIDRAREWLNEQEDCPDGDDPAWDARLAIAIEEIVDIDAEADEREARTA